MEYQIPFPIQLSKQAHNNIEISGIHVLDKKFNNKTIKEILNRKSTPAAVFKWPSNFEVDWNKA